MRMMLAVMRKREYLRPGVVITFDHPFIRGQFTQRHGAAGMQPLGGYGYLGTQTQLRAVGKAGAGVYIHGCRIHAGDKLVCIRPVFCQNAIGMGS